MRLLITGIVTLFLVSITPTQHQAGAPGEIRGLLYLDGTQSIQMRDTAASRRSRWGVVAASKQYFVFEGPRATLRVKTTTPAFQFDADPSFDDPVYLFRFDRKSDRREITVASGFGGLANFSLPKDHIIETSLEEISKGPDSTHRYRMKPVAPLRPGEYCISRNFSVCFDFGVD